MCRRREEAAAAPPLEPMNAPMARTASEPISIRCDQPGCGCRGHSFAWASDTHRCVWYEIPRNASSSIKAALGVPGYGAGGSDFRLLTLEERTAIDPSWRSFAVIRNPWERLRSTWRLFCRGDNGHRLAQARALFGVKPSEIDFHRFIALTAKHRNHHWAPQSSYLPQHDTGHAAVERLIRFDRLATELPPVLAAAGVAAPLSRLNASHPAPVGDPAPAVRKEVERRYAADFALLASLGGPAVQPA